MRQAYTGRSASWGAVDVGGGGTVALFVAGMDVDVVDMGVPILSMHAPFELASKLDIYNTYLAFCSILQLKNSQKNSVRKDKTFFFWRNFLSNNSYPVSLNWEK